MADLSSLLGAAGIGGAIGKAIVSLELDTAKYQGELKGAQASTVASTNSMGSSFSKFGSVASTAFAAIGVAAVAGLALSVNAAIEANEAHLKLQNTFKNNKLLSDSSVKSFEDQANALRDLTGVDDEAISGAQALLGQFKLTGSQITDLIPLIVDLSAKMGIDLEAAAKAVGKATQGSSGALARYGIILDKGALSADAFGATLKGLGVAQGFAADRAKAEPWRLIKAQFEEIAETIGQKLLPTIQDLSQTLVDNLPTVEAFAGGIDHLVNILSDIAQISFAPWTVAGDTFVELGGKIDELNLKFPELQSNLDSMKAKAALAAAGITNLPGAFDNSEIAAVSAGTEWHGLSKAGKDIAEGLRSDLPDIIGTVTKYKDVFDLSPSELVDITAEWVKIGQKMARDLREIAESDLSPAMKEAISALPPEMRAAWADGNAKQKGAIERSIRDAYNIKDELDKIANDAAGAAREIGRNIASGIALGITTSSELITVAAANAVHKSIEAARDAAKVKSPSAVMKELGLDMMEGLYIGITKGAQKVIDASRTSIEKTIDKIGSELDKVKDKAASFAESIRSGFGEFLDIGGAFGGAEEGTSLSSVIQTQLSGAQQLADVLNALKSQGAGKALLSEVAQTGAGFGQALLQGGPAQIEEANAALQTIADLAQLTGKGLSEAFFGEKTDRLEAKLDRLHDDLRELKEIEREGHDHAIILDGQKVSQAVRDQLVRTGGRNTDIFGGRA